MKKRFFIFILLQLFGLYYSQSDFDKDQHLIYTYLYSNEVDKAKAVIDSKFLNSDDDSKKIIGYVYLADYYYATEQSKKEIDALQTAKKLADDTKKSIDKAYVDFGFAKYYKGKSKNELFIKSLNKSINFFNKKPNENFILALLYEQKSSYTEKNRIEKLDASGHLMANQYALKANVPILINWTYNNLGNYYNNRFQAKKNKRDYDLVLNYYQKSFDYIKLVDNPAARKKALYAYYNNLSFTYSMIPSKYANSLELAFKALKIGENDKYLKVYNFYTYFNIGFTYELSGQFSLAEEYYLKAYAISDNKDYSFSDKIELFENLTNVYEKSNQTEKALEFSKKSHALAKNYYQKQFDDNIRTLEVYYKTEQQNQQIKQLEETNKIYAKQRFLYISIASLGFMGILFLVFLLRSRQKLNKQKTDLLEIEKKETQLILQLEQEEKSRMKAEQELLNIKQEQIQKEALAASLRLDSKNAFIKELKDELKEKQDPNLERILKNEQFTDNDLTEMQNTIQNVHPNFYKRLNDLSKIKLTNLDLKYAAYIYLNMDNQQISNILKADPNTVRVTKYRLKQKLGLTKDQDLTHFIQNLEM
ncbi:LuxR C-terminal-related transcriptional regulator [Epilithonimonas sp. JDS]|uniref:LuxR C-terminal-related transcriptional regulator n=1 Tax=Epilithonimonas sp. JDS TaxID=2902797 RepID=UPI001E33DEE6|nr:LuxR C-terminal-related transcriptional regulator [Epilithonimonas sp. JDS]MCD9854839.1 LuxR C-terminal-related transcriptional regulator [Epilithonimonas sp. JDS]